MYVCVKSMSEKFYYIKIFKFREELVMSTMSNKIMIKNMVKYVVYCDLDY